MPDRRWPCLTPAEAVRAASLAVWPSCNHRALSLYPPSSFPFPTEPFSLAQVAGPGGWAATCCRTCPHQEDGVAVSQDGAGSERPQAHSLTVRRETEAERPVGLSPSGLEVGRAEPDPVAASF